MYQYAWLPKNAEPRVASTRIRCLNILRRLRAEHFSIELYNSRHALRYRAVIFSKAYKPKHIALAEQLKAQGTKIILDLCDNHFLLKEGQAELRRIFALADHWVVSSRYLAGTVRAHLGDDKPLTVIEDAVEEDLHGSVFDVPGRIAARFAFARLRSELEHERQQRGATHLVWFGNYKASYDDAGLQHLNIVRELLEDIDREYPITLTVISNSRGAFDRLCRHWRLPTFYLDWNAHSFIRAMNLHRIAIIPIEINEFTAAKTNNRVALSLSLGLGVVADGIESYQVFKSCAFLDNWREGLLTYVQQPSILNRHVQIARDIIQRDFSIPVIAGQWRTVLESL